MIGLLDGNVARRTPQSSARTLAIGRAVILQGWSVAYREAHVLLEEIADAAFDGTRKDYLSRMQKVPRLIIDDLGLRKLPSTAAGTSWH